MKQYIGGGGVALYLSRRPAQGPSTQNMEVQVDHALPGVGPDVGDEPPSAGAFLAHPGGGGEHRGEEAGIVWSQSGGRIDVAFGDHEHMGGGRRVDVVESKHVVGLEHHIGGDGPGRDRAEETVGHELRPR